MLLLAVSCPLAPRWHIGPPHMLSNDSCLVKQCTPLSRNATLLWTSPFLVCTATFLAGPSWVYVRAVPQSLSGCCLRMCPMNRHLLLLTSSLNLSTLALSRICNFASLIAFAAWAAFPCAYKALTFQFLSKFNWVWVRYWRPRLQSFHMAFALLCAIQPPKLISLPLVFFFFYGARWLA